MAASMSAALTFSPVNRTHLRKLPPTHLRPIAAFPFPSSNSAPSSNFTTIRPLLFAPCRPSFHSKASASKTYSEEPHEALPSLFEEAKPLKLLLWTVVWASLSLAWFAASGDANAAADSIRASSFGLRFAGKLQSLGCPDEAVVFALATLPVIELRGAIPVGYWMQLKPVALTVLSVLGNMVPVPFIILYLKKLATFLAGRNPYASRVLELLFKRAKEKAGPVEEFQWLGLMLFVAVPFPGTGAWTGAIIASILDMPFWQALTANFVGVVLAGLLVNLLVNLGLKYAILMGVVLFFVSTFMWSILRRLSNSLGSPSG